MRKILLGTTAVVGLAIAAPAAFAQSLTPGGSSTQGATLTPAPVPAALAGAGGLTVRLGGYFEFTAANVQDDNDRATRAALTDGKARQRNDFRNDMELNVFVDGKAANGMAYGAVLEMQMDGVNTSNSTTMNFDEMYGFMKGSWGEFRFGQEDSAASLMVVRAPGAGPLGGDGMWTNFVYSSGTNANYLTSGINDGNDSTKIIYLSPQFAGFDVGFSYAPNAREGEVQNDDRNRTDLTNEISAALRYRGTFGGVGVAVGAAAMWADPPAKTVSGGATTQEFESVNAYMFGAQLAAFGFALGGEYAFGSYNGASVGRTAQRKSTTAGVSDLDDSSHWLVGLTYTTGPLVFGGIYGNGSQDNGGTLKDRDHTVWGMGVVYTLAPGLGIYAAYNNISDENIPTAAPVPGSTTLATFNGSNTRNIDVLMAGIRLAF